MNLKTLAGSRPQITLTVLTAQIVQQPVEIGGQFPRGLFEAQHELVVFGAALLSVILLVGSVIFEDLVGVFRDADFFCGQLLVEGVAEVLAGYFELFNFGQGFGGAFELNI